VRFVRQREGVDRSWDDFGSDPLNSGNKPSRRRGIRFWFGDELADQLIGTKSTQETHWRVPLPRLPVDGIPASEGGEYVL
jgi:hypothetical protein